MSMNKEKKKEYMRKYYIEHRDAIREQQGDHYENNKEAILERQAGRYRNNREAILGWQKERQVEFRAILGYMAGDVCPVCGGHMAIPLFHHPFDNKLHTVSHMAGCRTELIYAEIDKCEIMCRSCHNRTHKIKGG